MLLMCYTFFGWPVFFIVCQITLKPQPMPSNFFALLLAVGPNNIDTQPVVRAQVTLATVLNEIGQPGLPVQKTWRLNER